MREHAHHVNVKYISFLFDCKVKLKEKNTKSNSQQIAKKKKRKKREERRTKRFAYASHKIVERIFSSRIVSVFRPTEYIVRWCTTLYYSVFTREYTTIYFERLWMNSLIRPIENGLCNRNVREIVKVEKKRARRYKQPKRSKQNVWIDSELVVESWLPSSESHTRIKQTIFVSCSDRFSILDVSVSCARHLDVMMCSLTNEIDERMITIVFRISYTFY